MNFTVTVSNAIDQKVSERAMLSHSFYQAWTEGRLSLDTLRARHLRRQGHRCHCINGNRSSAPNAEAFARRASSSA
jgi:hypothetical protein